MTHFGPLASKAVYLAEQNIDTDAIFPARYLLLMERKGLGEFLFRDRRFRCDETKIAGFPLDDPLKQGAQIIIAGSGFGCGSSREQAVWSLYEFGIRCVIAPDFGEIFAINCAKNGLLAVPLPPETVEILGGLAEQGHVFDVNLEAGHICAGAFKAPIDVSQNIREALLNGWDDTDIILAQDGSYIQEFEEKHRRAQPWLFR